MAKQGERYNPKTKTGWKYENGKTVYYKKGRLTLEIPKRNRARGGAKRK